MTPHIERRTAAILGALIVGLSSCAVPVDVGSDPDGTLVETATTTAPAFEEIPASEPVAPALPSEPSGQEVSQPPAGWAMVEYIPQECGDGGQRSTDPTGHAFSHETLEMVKALVEDDPEGPILEYRPRPTSIVLVVSKGTKEVWVSQSEFGLDQVPLVAIEACEDLEVLEGIRDELSDGAWTMDPSLSFAMALDLVRGRVIVWIPEEAVAEGEELELLYGLKVDVVFSDPGLR